MSLLIEYITTQFINLFQCSLLVIVWYISFLNKEKIFYCQMLKWNFVTSLIVVYFINRFLNEFKISIKLLIIVLIYFTTRLYICDKFY